jgi:hypothetical protein
VPPGIALLVVQEQVARDIDVRIGREMVLERLDHVDHVLTVEVGFSHRPTIRSGIIDLALARSPSGRCHRFLLMHVSSDHPSR